MKTPNLDKLEDIELQLRARLAELFPNGGARYVLLVATQKPPGAMIFSEGDKQATIGVLEACLAQLKYGTPNEESSPPQSLQ